MTPLLRVDFHCHTHFSKDSLILIPDLLAAARRSGLDRLVITDHNSIGGALEAKELDPELVVVGEEIMTTKGELLAAFVSREIPAFLPPLEAISLLRMQGAFISVSHPFDLARHGWHLTDLMEIYPLVDAIEVFNARCVRPGINEQARQFAAEHGMAGTVGSDAHTLREVGGTALKLPEFSNADQLCKVIHQGQVEARLSPAWVHFGSSFARYWKQLRRKE
jgi:predicted metal-dependent phosphoesterase TrpH